VKRRQFYFKPQSVPCSEHY